MDTDDDSASLPMHARLEQAGLIWEEPVGVYELTEGARRLLGSWDRLGGRDPLEVLLDGGSYAELLLAMADACSSYGLAMTLPKRNRPAPPPGREGLRVSRP